MDDLNTASEIENKVRDGLIVQLKENKSRLSQAILQIEKLKVDQKHGNPSPMSRNEDESFCPQNIDELVADLNNTNDKLAAAIKELGELEVNMRSRGAIRDSGIESATSSMLVEPIGVQETGSPGELDPQKALGEWYDESVLLRQVTRRHRVGDRKAVEASDEDSNSDSSPSL